MLKTIFHLDLDTYFVSVERLLNPLLIGKAVIVGADPSKGRGVVAACSYEARQYGVHSGMPIRTAYRLCPDGCYVHGNYDEYIHFSNGVKNILSKYAPAIKQASIDEFIMDFTGCEKALGSLWMYASFLQKEIKTKLNLPSSIGIGSNKMIAKVASDCMKPLGVTWVVQGFEKEFLSKMPVETLPGVGKVMAEELHKRGFKLIKDVQNFNPEYFFYTFGKVGQSLWEMVNGRGSSIVCTSNYQQKSISKENTYGKDIVSKEVLRETLFYLTSKVAQGLRDEGLQAFTIGIKLRYSDFNTLTRAKSVKRATDDDIEIFEIAWDLLQKAFTRRVAVRLIGVHLSNLTQFSEQEELFEDPETKRKKLLKAVSQLRGKYGFTVVQVGSV